MIEEMATVRIKTGANGKPARSRVRTEAGEILPGEDYEIPRKVAAWHISRGVPLEYATAPAEKSGPKRRARGGEKAPVAATSAPPPPPPPA